ncbi:MAG: cupin domain-containing protein [Chloroflexota bacterium]
MSETITNSTTGETITFLSRTPERLVFEDTLPANHPGVPLHIHTMQEETFTVLEGVFLVELDGEAYTLQEGEQVVVPKGAPHRFHTRNSEAVKLRVELTPALDYEIMFRSMALAAEDNKNILLQLAVMHQDLTLGFYLGGIPKPFQDVMFGALAFIARRVGYKTHFSTN